MSDPVPYETSGSKYIALGLKVDYSQGWPQLQYPDNTPVPDTLVGTAFEWEDASYPKNDNVSECVAFNGNKKVVNMECNITGGDHLTYLCEARPIESIKDPRGNLCVFPFIHNNVTYDSCAQPDDTNSDISALAFDRPWCATAVDSRGAIQ